MSVITLHKDSTPTPDNLVWENPPARRTTGKYAGIVTALRARPGDWAVILTVPSTLKKRAWGFSSHVNTGKYIDFKPNGGHFESLVRSADDVTRVYVRFIPETEG